MHVLLTGGEYEALKDAGRAAEERVKATLTEACMLIALKVPLETPPWLGRAPIPWGCPHDKDARRHGLRPQQEYCDHCLARNWCPLPKNWSK